MKRINIAVVPPVLLPSNLVHIGTEYKVSRNTLFVEEDLLVNEVSETNLYEKKFTLNIDKDDTFYAVTRYKYMVLNEDGSPLIVDNENVYKFGIPSMITPFKGDQDGVRISDTIVKTPKLEIKESFEFNPKGNVLVIGNDFEMFSSIGKHIASTWVVTDLEGKILFNREKDYDNLITIELPEEIRISTNFIVYCMYHTDTNAYSNYGLFANVITNRMPKYQVEMYGDLWVGVDAQFRIKLINATYDNCSLIVKQGESIISSHVNIRDFIFVPTPTYTVGLKYDFIFTIVDSKGVSRDYVISKFAKAYKDRFKNKDYLDKYDYSGMLITKGLTKTLSYQLINNAILLFRNNTKNVSLAKYVNILENNNLQIVGDILTLPVTKDILDPSTFVKELLNGNTVISYISRDNATFGKIFINTYEHNFFNNDFKLINTVQLMEEEELVMPGSMVTSGQFVYYIKYHDITGNRLVKLNPYSGGKKEFILPINVKRGISIVADLDNNIYLMGGTNDDVADYSIIHKRHNNNVFRFSIETETFTKIGNNLLENVNNEIYQFHIAPRYGDKKQEILGYTLFNTIDNNNFRVVNDQSTYVLDVTELTVTYMNNDHLDNLLYGNTIVLNNGDVVRYGTTDDDTNKVYTYISDSKKIEDTDDEGNIIRDGNNLIVKNTTTITKFDLCRYDSVFIEPTGTLIITGGDVDEICYSDTLVVTRDMVLDNNIEFVGRGYSNVVIACPNANLVLR